MRQLPAVCAAAAALVLTAGCNDIEPNVSVAPEIVPGDPVIYAPDGWPLQIGDRVTRGRRNSVASGFPGWGGLYGIHLVANEVYSARFREVSEPLGDGREYHYVYEGHFVQTASPLYALLERSPPGTLGPGLAPEFHGKIRYREPTVFEAARMEQAQTGRPLSELAPRWVGHPDAGRGEGPRSREDTRAKR